MTTRHPFTVEWEIFLILFAQTIKIANLLLSRIFTQNFFKFLKTYPDKAEKQTCDVILCMYDKVIVGNYRTANEKIQVTKSSQGD